MTEEKAERQKRDWFGLILTTVIGIAATVLVAWYQFYLADKEAALAEKERVRAVRQSVISIIEEHILNGKPIETTRLARLIDQRRREDGVITPIALSEVLEQAEFNILSSRYLAFDKKEGIKPIFDSLYDDLSKRSFSPISTETPNADFINNLARKIQEGKSPEALDALKLLQEFHQKELREARRRGQSLDDVLDQVKKDPMPYAVGLVAYILFIFWFFRNSPKFMTRFARILFRSRDRDV